MNEKTTKRFWFASSNLFVVYRNPTASQSDNGKTPSEQEEKKKHQ